MSKITLGEYLDERGVTKEELIEQLYLITCGKDYNLSYDIITPDIDRSLFEALGLLEGNLSIFNKPINYVEAQLHDATINSTIDELDLVIACFKKEKKGPLQGIDIMVHDWYNNKAFTDAEYEPIKQEYNRMIRGITNKKELDISNINLNDDSSVASDISNVSIPKEPPSNQTMTVEDGLKKVDDKSRELSC